MREVHDAVRQGARGGVGHQHDIDVTQHRGAARRSGPQLHRRERRPVAPDVAQTVDRANGLEPDDTVGAQSRVRLEVPHGPLGEGPEDPVGSAAGEPQRVHRPLQRADVSAVKIGVAQIQEAIAEGEGRIDQSGPGVVSDLAVLVQAAGMLERADGGERGSVEHAVDAGRPKVGPERYEAPLDVFDRGTTVTLTDGSHSRPLAGVTEGHRRRVSGTRSGRGTSPGCPERAGCAARNDAGNAARPAPQRGHAHSDTRPRRP